PGVGEALASTHAAGATIALSLEPPGAVPWLDGRRFGGSPIATRAGEHALVVTWDGAPVWAGWIETPAGSSALRIAVPASPPCSRGDLARAHALEGRIEAGEVRCGAWIAALHGERPDGVALASCRQDACGALVEWAAPAAWTWTPPVDHRPRGWPTWATWGLVGASAAVVTGVVLVASGAFQAAPTQTHFVSGGLTSQ
ncbi:MAG: hypothetical protein ACRELB_15615, partial [Polyangiaceae bacterium]